MVMHVLYSPYSHEYNSDSGELTIYFTESDDQALQYDSFEFVPTIDEDKGISWGCYSTVSYNLMPDDCYVLEEKEEEEEEGEMGPEE